MPTSLNEGLEKLPNFSKWAAALRKEESVMWVYDEEGILSGTRNRLAKMKSK